MVTEISQIENSGRGVNYKILAHRAIGTGLILEIFGPDFSKCAHYPASPLAGLLL